MKRITKIAMGCVIAGLIVIGLVVKSSPHPLVQQTPVAVCGIGISVKDIVAATNKNRIVAGVAPLTEDSRLDRAAQLKAQDMIINNYWAHTSPSGVTPWYWFRQVGYAYTYAGENLAEGFATSDGVMNGWMNSPGHKANMLNANFEDIGVYSVCGTIQGEYSPLTVAEYGS